MMWRAFSCKACGTPLFHPSRVLGPTSMTSRPRMADGASIAILDSGTALALDEHPKSPEHCLLMSMHQLGWSAFTRARMNGHETTIRVARWQVGPGT